MQTATGIRRHSLALLLALAGGGPLPAAGAATNPGLLPPPMAQEAASTGREGGSQDLEALRAEAQARYGEQSFTLALRAYDRMAALPLEPQEAAWVAFRRADCAWRAEAASRGADTTVLERAAETLEGMAKDPDRPEQRDRIWAEANESLGDYHWDRPDRVDLGSALPRYRNALGWWGASSDLDLARRRYLDIVFRIAKPRWARPHQLRYQLYQVPLDLLENAAKIAVTPEDRGRAQYLLGSKLAAEGRQPARRGLVERAFGAVLELGRGGEHYDDALFGLAQYLADVGRPRRGTGGGWTWEPDFPRALELYRQLVREFDAGESPYVDDARRAIEEITRAQVFAGTDRFFLPGSRLEIRLGWRNLDEVRLRLFRVDLTRDLLPDARRDEDGDPYAPGQWLEVVDLQRLEALRTWSHATGDDGLHLPGQTTLPLEGELGPGAYVVEARGGGQEARALVLVSDVALTTKATDGSLLAWLTDVRTGRPQPGARLFLWEQRHEAGSQIRRLYSGTTDDDGTFLFDLERASDSRRRSGSSFFLAAAVTAEDGAVRQAFAASHAPGPWSPSRGWRAYAFADRTAYRPGDEVSWKAIVRRHDGSRYHTPAGETLAWKVKDARGQVMAEGEGTLDGFGTLTGALTTTEAMALGSCRLELHHAQHGHLTNAELFRLEEYVRPEFEVAVKVPQVPLDPADPDGPTGPVLYALGDRVELDVEASYYFGGPVTSAQVEVFVFQRPFHHSWPVERAYPWLHEQPGRSWWGGQGQQVAHLALESDAEGRISFGFDTPATAGMDYEYTVEAHVTDASRRQIVGTGSVRVTRTEFFARVTAEHAIHRPGAEVELEVETRDPSGNPVGREGTVEVHRQRVVEIFRDPRGRELPRQELDRAGARADWSLVRQEVERELVARTSLTTGSDGTARWSFTPETDGDYVVTWRGVDGRGNDVVGETHVYVADEASRELGLASGGLDILVDRDTLAVGGEAVLLLSTAGSGRWVLLTTESERLHDYRVLHLEGSVKLVRLAIDERHVPNAWVTAVSTFDATSHVDSEPLVVPPVDRFLDVELTHDADEVLPGSEGSLAVRVRDKDGNPVRAQLALTVVDDSLAYIQGDLAGDPRAFFYGDKRPQLVTTGSSFHQGRYELLKEEDRRDGEQDRDGWGTYRGPGDSVPPAGRPAEAQEELSALGYAGGRSEAKAMRQRGALADAPAASVPMANEAPEGTGGAEIRVRKDFRETALWVGVLETDAEGRASVTVPFPDSTTRWRSSVWGVDRGTRVGRGDSSVRTRQPLIARLQAPRFFVEGDEVTVSANLNNNTAADLRAAVTLDVEGLELLHRIEGTGTAAPRVEGLVVPAGREVRVDWRVRAEAAGTAVFRLRADAGTAGDALERRYPVHAHGIEALVARSGRMDGEEVRFALDVPGARDPDTTRFVVQVTPSLAVTMLDALPYLIDYPYGCTEQTLSRFVPSVIVARTLERLGLSRADAMGRVFGGIEPDTAAATHPEGKRGLEELDAITARGLARLYDLQHGDGGWSWWKSGDSDPFMTAYVVWGLSLAREAGVDVRAAVLENAARWLARQLVEAEQRVDLQAWMLHALATYGGPTGDPKSGAWMDRAFANLWERRGDLNVYGRALFTLAAHATGRSEEARVLVDNLVDGAQLDDRPDTSLVQVGAPASRADALRTAHWGDDGIGYRWSDGSVEATAFALRALVAVDPGHELVEPAANWLVKNRRGAQWSNTRDTAIVVLALCDYVERTGQLASEVGFEVAVNGQVIATRSFGPAELLRAPSTFDVDRELLVDGPNEVRVRRTAGEGPLYFAARCGFFSREEPIPARGSELFLRREHFRLRGRPTLLGGLVYDRVPLADGDSVGSGDRIEVVLTIETKNDLEYLVFEDLKPGGFEAVQVRSGEPAVVRELKRGEVERTFAGEGRGQTTRGLHERALFDPGYTGRSHRAHQELRDRKVAFFLSRLQDGFWEVRYELRAETPGSFHALPVLGHAMYVPEVRANGTELRVHVQDAD